MPWTANTWSEFLARELERPVRVRFGRARRDVIVARSDGEDLQVRMNACFAEAPEAIRSAVAGWLRSGRRARRACRELDRWIAEHVSGTPPERRRVTVAPRGAVHDLAEIARDLIREELPLLISPERAPRITWGRRGRRRARRSIQLGSYDAELELVRIHPVLDQPAVPRFYVRAVVFHELLHAALDREPGQRPHGPTFRRLERAYPDHGRVLAWEERHIDALIRSARTGRPMPSVREKAKPGLFPWLVPARGAGGARPRRGG